MSIQPPAPPPPRQIANRPAPPDWCYRCARAGCAPMTSGWHDRAQPTALTVTAEEMVARMLTAERFAPIGAWTGGDVALARAVAVELQLAADAVEARLAVGAAV